MHRAGRFFVFYTKQKISLTWPKGCQTRRNLKHKGKGEHKIEDLTNFEVYEKIENCRVTCKDSVIYQ